MPAPLTAAHLASRIYERFAVAGALDEDHAMFANDALDAARVFIAELKKRDAETGELRPGYDGRPVDVDGDGEGVPV